MSPPDADSRPPVTGVDLRIGRLVKRVSVSMRARLDLALRAVGLTVPQYVSMVVLNETPRISGAELARRSFVARQTAHEVLADLRDRGWVVASPSAVDRRAVVLELTAAGREALTPAIAAVEGIEAELADALGSEGVSRLAQLLMQLDDVLNPGVA